MVGFPLLLIPLAICNIIVFLMPGVSFSAPLFTLPLMSGVGWPVTLSDALLALGILMLLFEVIKGARPGAKYVTDHLLSLIVFGAAASEFLLLPQFGTSTYFLLTSLALVDFLSGIALRVRRPRMASVANASAASTASANSSEKTASERTPAAKAVEARNAAPVEPRFDSPAPASAPVASTPKAEPVVEPAAAAPHSDVEPVVVTSEAVTEPREPQVPSPEEVPSPEVQSPGLQPGSGAHPSDTRPN